MPRSIILTYYDIISKYHAPKQVGLQLHAGATLPTVDGVAISQQPSMSRATIKAPPPPVMFNVAVLSLVAQTLSRLSACTKVNEL